MSLYHFVATSMAGAWLDSVQDISARRASWVGLEKEGVEWREGDMLPAWLAPRWERVVG